MGMAKLPAAVERASAPRVMSRPNAAHAADRLVIADPNTVPGYPEAAKLFTHAADRFRAGDHAAAAELFAQVIKCTPGMVAAHNNMGVALVLAGRHEAAAAAFRRAVEIAPGYVMAYANLGLTLRDQGRLEEA